MQPPSGLSPEFEVEAQQLALEAFDALGCRTWGRIDFMMDETGHLLLIEATQFPAWETIRLKQAAQASGMDMPMLIEQIPRYGGLAMTMKQITDRTLMHWKN